MQEVRVSGRIIYRKVLGTKNPADLMTKHMSAELAKSHLGILNMQLTGGRAESAPTLDAVDSYVEGWYDGDNDDAGNIKRVRFAATVQMRAIPVTGRNRATPPRGSGRGRSVDSCEEEISTTATRNVMRQMIPSDASRWRAGGGVAGESASGLSDTSRRRARSGVSNVGNCGFRSLRLEGSASRARFLGRLGIRGDATSIELCAGEPRSPTAAALYDNSIASHNRLSDWILEADSRVPTLQAIGNNTILGSRCTVGDSADSVSHSRRRRSVNILSNNSCVNTFIETVNIC